MPSDKIKSAEVEAHFRKLSSVASTLNKSSDGLTEAVGILEESLRKLNIGLDVWTTYSKFNDECAEHVWEREIGYAKTNGKWGIALRKTHTYLPLDEVSTDGPWIFGEAPRELRIDAAEHLPRLLEALSKRAEEFTRELDEATERVSELAGVVKQLLPDDGKKARGTR